jgi:threonine aldolase
MATRIARGLASEPGVRLLNEVVLNQVLFDVDGDEALTKATIANVQAGGAAWFGGTTYHGTPAARISVSNWDTREVDADATIEAIRQAIASARAAR